MSPTKDPDRCERCGGSDLVRGKVRAEWTSYFVPDEARSSLVVNQGTPIRGVLCMGCEDLRLFGDSRWVAKVLGRFVP